MVYGKHGTEIISLNEDTLWSGYPNYKGPKNKADIWRQIRKLTEEEKFAQAQILFEDELASSWTQSYLPLGDLIIKFNHNDINNYQRSLDLETAVSSVSYDNNGIFYTREIFISAVDNCMVVHLLADRNGSINCELSLLSRLRFTVSVQEPFLSLDGIAPSNVQPSYIGDVPDAVVYSDKNEEKGMRFTIKVQPIVNGGTFCFENNTLKISGADSVLLFVDGQTSFAGYNVLPYLHGKDEKTICQAVLENASAKTYDKLLKNHKDDYRSFYSRVTLDLGENKNIYLPTDVRLRQFYKEKNDPALYTLLFQFGRYLLLAGSRLGTQVTNLQGIWNEELRPPWSSNYTININTQMNYWPCFPCALEETQLPLIEFIKTLAITGRVSAAEIYGAHGFTAHHNSDVWAASWPVGNRGRGTCGYAAWNFSAAWFCAHLFERYEYTLDNSFLKETAYPIMKEAALYLLDILSEDQNGHLWVCPSTSPENSFIIGKDRLVMSGTATMSIAITKELFSNCVKAANILDIDKDFVEELEKKISILFPFQIGSQGQLLEWDKEYEEAEPQHRHISHLYGLHPGNQINFDETPELAAACKRTLELRGDDGTGWSLAWKVNLWARLGDGNHIITILDNQLRLVEEGQTKYSKGGGTYPNMFCAHPPFQIDGNYGISAGFAEMFLQNTQNGIHLLPALPDIWKKGSIKGLRAKRNITVDISWDEKQVSAVIYSANAKTLGIRCRGRQEQMITLEAGINKLQYGG
jgi:alpha-L-fucosidase 2